MKKKFLFIVLATFIISLFSFNTASAAINIGWTCDTGLVPYIDMTWDSVGSGGEYKVWRDGDLVSTQAETNRYFKDTNVDFNSTYTYVIEWLKIHEDTDTWTNADYTATKSTGSCIYIPSISGPSNATTGVATGLYTTSFMYSFKPGTASRQMYTLKNGVETWVAGGSDSLSTNITFPSAGSWQVCAEGILYEMNSAPGSILNTTKCMNVTVTTPSYTVSGIVNGGNGVISPGSVSVTSGNTTNFTLTPNSGYVINTVTGNTNGCATGSLSGNIYTTGPITGGCTVTATFLPGLPTTTTLNVTSSGATNAPISLGSPAGNGVADDTDYTITVTNDVIETNLIAGAVSGKTFTGWSGCNSGSANPCGVIVSNGGEKTVTANYVDEMTGTLSASNCTIASGASSCNTSITWSVSNRESTTTAVTTPTNITVISSTGTSGSGSYALTPPGNRTFYLYNNAKLLDQDTASAVCASGTSWVSGVCTPTPTPVPVVSISANPTSGTVNIVNPTITWSATESPTSCTASGDWSGTKAVSGSQAQGVLTTVKTYVYTMTCTNANGTSAPASATVSVSSPSVMSGTLTASNCTVPLGGSSCNTNLSWSVTNPESPSTAVTTPTNITVGTGHSNTATYSISPASARTFYLYNNAQLLDQDTATATCASGTWNGSICASGGGYSTNANMDIAGLLTYSPASPTAGGVVTFNATARNLGPDAVGGSTFTRLKIDLGNATGSNPIWDVNLDESTADLVSGASEAETWYWTAVEGQHTIWACADGTNLVTEPNENDNCAALSPVSGVITVAAAPSSSSISLTANPMKIATGDSTTLTWTSSGSTSCVGDNFSTSGSLNGSVVINPVRTTTYTLNCSDVSQSASVTVKVQKKPWYIEN